MSFISRIVRAFFPSRKPATVTIVSPLRAFEYRTLHAHKPTMVGGGTVNAVDEASALKMIYTLSGERVQFIGGGRYRSHGSETFTRIDRVPRDRPERRRRERTKAMETTGGTVGE
jgi:hypothetical protein